MNGWVDATRNSWVTFPNSKIYLALYFVLCVFINKLKLESIVLGLLFYTMSSVLSDLKTCQIYLCIRLPVNSK